MKVVKKQNNEYKIRHTQEIEHGVKNKNHTLIMLVFINSNNFFKKSESS